MTLIDSSGWIEFFTDGPLASSYGSHLKELKNIVTPTVVLYEVYKVIKRQRSEEEALAAAAQMGKTHLVPLTDAIALTAADVSLAHGIAMADTVPARPHDVRCRPPVAGLSPATLILNVSLRNPELLETVLLLVAEPGVFTTFVTGNSFTL